MIQSASQAVDDTDADVLVESEEIQPPMSRQNVEMQSTTNQETEKRPQWCSNMSFADCMRNSVGFSVTNQGFSRNASPHVKQPKMASNQIEKHPDVPEILREIEKNHRIMIVMRGTLEYILINFFRLYKFRLNKRFRCTRFGQIIFGPIVDRQNDEW